MRGSRSAQALGMRVYRLSDVEEDDDMLRLPHSSHIYTFTNRYSNIVTLSQYASYFVIDLFLRQLLMLST